MSKPCQEQEHEWFIPQSGSSDPHCVRCGYGTESPSAGARATPHDVDRARNQQLDQLKANAKEHKKHVDRLSAKIGLLTAENEKLKKNAKTKWSTLLIGAAFVCISGFLLTLGFFAAVGWVGFIGGLMR